VDGRVAKRRAEDLAAAARGVHDVQNRLTIPRTEPSSRPPQT
jgi:osmotically-inducible protein OsmY